MKNEDATGKYLTIERDRVRIFMELGSRRGFTLEE
jgi:hypothetical protein